MEPSLGEGVGEGSELALPSRSSLPTQFSPSPSMEDVRGLGEDPEESGVPFPWRWVLPACGVTIRGGEDRLEEEVSAEVSPDDTVSDLLSLVSSSVPGEIKSVVKTLLQQAAPEKLLHFSSTHYSILHSQVNYK